MLKFILISSLTCAASLPAFCTWAAPPVANKNGSAATFDWLDLRRQGPNALLQAAARVNAPELWQATYLANLPTKHALYGLSLTVARAPSPAVAKAKGPTAGPDAAATTAGSLLVRFNGPAKLKGVGVVAVNGKIWLRLPTKAAGPEIHADLFQNIDALGVPLAVFVAADTKALFTLVSEGEFDDVGMLRMKPIYEAGPGLEPMKLGLSKNNGAFVALEVTDLQGKPKAGLLWLDTTIDDGLAVHKRLRLRPVNEANAIELELVELRRGKAAGKIKFVPADLK